MYSEQGLKADFKYVVPVLGGLLPSASRVHSRKESLRDAHLWNPEAQELPAEDEAGLRLWKLVWQWANRKLIFLYFTEEMQTRLHAEQGSVGRRLLPILVELAGVQEEIQVQRWQKHLSPWAVFQCVW